MRLFADDTKITALRRPSLFERLSREELSELAKMTEEVDVAPGRCTARKVRSVASCS